MARVRSCSRVQYGAEDDDGAKQPAERIAAKVGFKDEAACNGSESADGSLEGPLHRAARQ